MKRLRAAKAKKVMDLNAVKSVMFVRLGKLGDMMAASWILKAVRGQYPHLKIGLLTLPRSAGLFKYNPDIAVLRLWRPVTAPFLVVTERLRGWDLVVDLNDEPSRRSVLALKILSPRSSIAFDNAKSRGNFKLTVKTLVKEKSHVLERLSVMAAGLGVKTKNTELSPVAYLKEGSVERISAEQAALCGKSGKVISLNISAGHKSRYWGEEKWVQLGAALMKADKKICIRVLGSPADLETVKRVSSRIGNAVLPAAKSGLNDFLASIAASDMLISPDTSAVHAACAFNVPVLGLYPDRCGILYPGGRPTRTALRYARKVKGWTRSRRERL